MQVIVNISLKHGVLDPQGRAIGRSLTDLGFNEVSDVRVGKQITLDVDEDDPARARQRVARMCETLLANTVIEDYEIEIAEEASE
jgi:phosphoribosylformylglycinamidine synthase PurS subunit